MNTILRVKSPAALIKKLAYLALLITTTSLVEASHLTLKNDTKDQIEVYVYAHTGEISDVIPVANKRLTYTLTADGGSMEVEIKPKDLGNAKKFAIKGSKKGTIFHWDEKKEGFLLSKDYTITLTESDTGIVPVVKEKKLKNNLNKYVGKDKNKHDHTDHADENDQDSRDDSSQND